MKIAHISSLSPPLPSSSLAWANLKLMFAFLSTGDLIGDIMKLLLLPFTHLCMLLCSSYAHWGNDKISELEGNSEGTQANLRSPSFSAHVISGSKSDRAVVQIPIHLVAFIPLPTEMEQGVNKNSCVSFTSAAVSWQTHRPIYGKSVFLTEIAWPHVNHLLWTLCLSDFTYKMGMILGCIVPTWGDKQVN